MSVGRSDPSPSPRLGDLLDQDRSSLWSGFDDELPPNKEAQPLSLPAAETQAPPTPAPLPPQQPQTSQATPDPTLTLLMTMMSSFQSDMKSVCSEQSGSVTSLVAEDVTAWVRILLIHVTYG